MVSSGSRAEAGLARREPWRPADTASEKEGGARGKDGFPRVCFRCPYCGSSETNLENIFGPTPCRSLRYCTSCKQPFEQFKTI